MHRRYGEFVSDGSELVRPDVSRITGARLSGPNIEVQWMQGGHLVQLGMSLQNAMTLLTLLQAIHSDTGEPLPAEPPRAP